ncbi:MAG: surfeit locus protein [Pycnora praestabilis]|nr:MAG: surfeit locus protein [Pycnora praestabilis]
MSDTLEERLKSHAKAFDGLLSLIPAKYYYGEDNTDDQWKKKKQTKEEAQKAKRAKLDPDSAKSAKDVMDENERKRKREEEGSDVEVLGIEQPKEGLQVAGKKSKKQKREEAKGVGKDEIVEAAKMANGDPSATQQADASAQKLAKAEKSRKKKEHKKAKEATKEQKLHAKKARKGKQEDSIPDDGRLDGSNSDEVAIFGDGVGDINILETDGISHEIAPQPTASPSPAVDSPIFDASADHSETSSISSSVPPTTSNPAKKSTADPEELNARLQARIQELRAARKADGINGSPARNRQELMDARRRKEEQRRAHKKELRLKQRVEEQREREEALALKNSPASGSNAGSLRTRDTEADNSFSYGRIAFNDGQQLDSGLATLIDPRKRKGPQDPFTAIKAADGKRARIGGLDEEKRANIEEKDLWLNARKRAHGEKVRDDTNLLKKTLKRKEKAKKKSESEWKGRLEGVEKGKAMKQKKREENLRKRKDEKGMKGKKKPAKGGKKKNRPGFEGSFKAKAGGKRS